MLRERVVAALGALRLSVGEADIDALVLHAGMMLAANRVHNLTRITEEQDVAFLHVADSLAALPYLASAPAGAFADLGSGPGYPGIPLALLSHRHVALVESRSKKAAFLEEVVGAVGVDAEVCGERAEELAAVRRESFAAVTARALAALPSLVELAAPLLVEGGCLIALKGEPGADEVRAGDTTAAKVGLARTSADSFVLPVAGVTRTIVCYRREGPSRVALPRRPGMAQRDPLA